MVGAGGRAGQAEAPGGKGPGYVGGPAMPRSTGFTEWERKALEGFKQVNDTLWAVLPERRTAAAWKMDPGHVKNESKEAG